MFKNYKKKAVQPMRPYVKDEDMTGINVSPEDAKLKSLVGGMIAVNADDEKDQWYISKRAMKANYELVDDTVVESSEKSLGNTDVNGATKNVSDLVVFGNGDLFQLISKASSKSEGWMKSTKAARVPNGCLVQVTTQQGDHVAEALTFVPGIKIIGDGEERRFAAMTSVDR